MRSKYQSLLYIILVLLFLSGLFLLFLRQSFIEYFREIQGVDAVQVSASASLPKEKLLDTSILEHERLKELRNYVQVFSIENICGESINAGKRCAPGNKNPFLAK